MKNHEFLGSASHYGDFSHIRDEEGPVELRVREYEKELAEMDTQPVYLSTMEVLDRLDALTLKSLGSPREIYDSEDEKEWFDRLRLFSEAETLYNYHYGFKGDNKSIPESKFFRHLTKTCRDIMPDTPPLSDNEVEHFRNSGHNFIKHLSTETTRERTFSNYIRSLVLMCASAYGTNSRALMYLCDDLDRMLAPQKDEVGNTIDNKSKIIDRLIERKLDAVQKIAMGKIFSDPDSGVLVGFTSILDLPNGIETRSVKELVEEGVPCLYNYAK